MKRIFAVLGVLCVLFIASVLLGANTPGARLARGYIFRGNSSAVAAAYDANDNAKILVGDGTDLVSVSLSQDASITSGGVVSVSSLRDDVAETNLSASWADHTSVDFTAEPWAVLFAKTTMAIVTEADTQEDFLHTRRGVYFEVFQDGANSDMNAGFVPGSTGWLLPGANAADMGFQLTEGIVLGSARSFLTGTDAFYMRAAFYVVTRATLNNLMIGFRKLGAYAVADDSTEIATAYDDKVIVGIDGNAGVIKQMTSLATVDVTTSCTHAAAANGDILALEVSVSAGRVTSVKVGNATPAGTTAAQMQAGVTAAYAALTADTLCNAATITMTTATNVVPTVMLNKAAGGVSDITIVNYYAGLQ